MLPKNSYFYLKSALSSQDCDRIVNLGLSKFEELKKSGIETRAGTKGENDKRYFEKQNKKLIPKNDLTIEELKNLNSDIDVDKDTYIRDSEVCWLTDTWIFDLVMPLVDKANKLAGWKYDYEATEAFQFTKYGLNQFYGWHTDGGGCHYDVFRRHIPGVTPLDSFGDPLAPYSSDKNLTGLVRKISVTINLNNPEDYDGGLLKFDYGPHTEGNRFHLCEEIKPKGSIIVFPSYVHHQVTPVTKGTRYSLVLWVSGKPFR